MNFFMYKDKKGEWRWSLKAVNGNVIADSGEGYKNRKDCGDMIDRIKTYVHEAVLIMVDADPRRKK